MKKIVIIFALMAMVTMAGAQQIRYIYVPGDGEHRLGLTVGPAFGMQSILAQINGGEKTTINNALGFNGGFFWGYETDHGRAVDFGNIMTIGFSGNSYHGEVADELNVSYKMSTLAKAVWFNENPFLSFRIGDQIILSAGVGISIVYPLNGAVKVDGNKLPTSASDDEGDILAGLAGLKIMFDANLGAKYFFAENAYLGATLRYNFYGFGIDDLMEESSEMTVAGAMAADLNKNEGRSIFLSVNKPFMLNFQIGYCW